ncbi:acetylating acetaldehyde dehydrogenase [Streptomyces sp. H39-S7]|uniref:acetylating acetaldehyde dehydrogenase n=1 Tax=Streptomyces sp. H39-S7 TaxID=3004357 RepID=UPI0022AFD5D0|nr:acetaldehyde dehydrogenase (acetylating) [Streptomyces sp. H39-S7]MCZ4120293.1 acetaldehyde dehydrogenase (acetylating) [Streptomyces sp. H39-S7]
MTGGRTTCAVLGAGLIGIDLAEKIHRSGSLDLALVVGRDQQSLGLRRAAELGCATGAGGLESLIGFGPVDVVFDASNADCHPTHWCRLRETGTTVIDLTPAGLGTAIVPTINGDQVLAHRHTNLVSCGGQAAIPVLHALAQYMQPTYIEVVSTAASASAGRATRLNLDQYIATTQDAIHQFTGAPQVKVMVNLSPAKPEPPFRVVVTALGPTGPPGPLHAAVAAVAAQVRAYAAGFVVSSVAVDDRQVRVALEVTAEGGRLPRYAGNLDLINGAAVQVAEQYAAALPSQTANHA